MSANAHRRACRVTAENLRPGMYVAPWNQHLAPHRLVLRIYSVEDNAYLIEWPDRTVSRHHRWSVWHRR